MKEGEEPRQRTPEEWRASLTPEQYEICINHRTEPPFLGRYERLSPDGTYRCVCCGEDLFSSKAKYDSGSGWPSFWKPISESNIEYVGDYSYGMTRTEVNCGRCGSHLGHVFDDGPAPTNQRYCINSVSLVHETDCAGEGCNANGGNSSSSSTDTLNTTD